MRFEIIKDKNEFVVDSENLDAYGSDEIVLIKLTPPIVAVKGDKPSDILSAATKVVGQDADGCFYYFFQSNLHVGQNHNRGFFIEGDYYKLLMKETAPCSTFLEFKNVLPIFDKNLFKYDDKISKDAADDDKSADDLARHYLKHYKFKRYNNTFFYFNPEIREWCGLNIKDYDTFNIMLSMHTRKFSAKTKRAIMDSLIPYLYDEKYVEHIKEVNSNLLLFKNKRVLDIRTMKSRPFSENDFIYHMLDANWYDDGTDELKMVKPNKYLEALINGVSGIRVNDNNNGDLYTKQRREDLLSYIGYTLTNETKEASTLILYGTGRNGKTTLSRLIYDIKNSSFSMRVEKFLNDTHYGAGFYNKRMLFFDELQKEQVTDQFIGEYKALTGSNVLNIRPIQKEPYDVQTNFVTYITTNAVSELFLKDRALARRIKILNATKPAPLWSNPKDDFNKGVKEQVNKDWLANYCIRKFVQEEGCDISGLFTYDMKTWAVNHNNYIRDLLTAWKTIGWFNYQGDPFIFTDDLIHLILTASGGMFQMSKGRVGDFNENDLYFDEQMNLLFINLLNLPNTRCEQGYVRYDADFSSLVLTPTEGDYYLSEKFIDNNSQTLSFTFKHGETGLTKLWKIHMRQEYTIRYVLKAVFGWDGKNEQEWPDVIDEHIRKKTKFNVATINGSVVIYKPNVNIIQEQDENDWYREVLKLVKGIEPTLVNKRKEIVRSYFHILTDAQIETLFEYINESVAEL